ncbi:unnamed protein product [Blepharisma stoltei]|uniref:Viral A-type inclusion protein n=1 Tax=Blepharisma stoltei TaxID=1481888 RepID=A0AAU9JM35_9CILI|nr:unnamed protein product [Blepharisma stoltei]
MNPSTQIAGQLSSIKKSNLSLADALREIELAKQSFEKISMLERTINNQNLHIQELSEQMQHFVLATLFTSKLDEVSYMIEKAVKAKFEEFSAQFYNSLNDKLSIADAEVLLKQKVMWSAHNGLSQELGNLKSRLDKHIFSDFEGLKTKMKIEFSQMQTIANKETAEISSDEVAQIKARVVTLEQQLQEIFNEEDEEQDESYDSEEELDGMMDDLERTVLRERRAREAEMNYEEENEELHEEAPEKQVVVQEEAKNLPQISADINSQQLKEEIKEEKLETPRENIPKEEEKAATTLQNLPVSLSEITELEESRKNLKTRGSSRANDVGRMSSRSSSVGKKLVGGAGLSQINKKLAAFQKDIEANRKAIEDNQNYIAAVEAELQKTIHETIHDIIEQHKELEAKTQTMEMSFIKALRRKGISTDKKSEKKQVEIPKREIDKIHKEIDEKLKRIVVVETYVNKVVSDMKQVKSTQKQKLNEIIKYLHYISEDRTKLMGEFNKANDSIKSIGENLQKNLVKVQGEVLDLQGPMTDLISDQQRENIGLTQEIRRNQELVRSMVENIPNSVSQAFERSSFRESSLDSSYAVTARVQTASPKISVKHRFYSSNNKYRLSSRSVNHDANWLKSLPDSNPLALPRISRHSLNQSVISEIETRSPE